MENSIYIKKLKEIHEVLLDYLDNEHNEEQDFNDFIEKILSQNILENKCEFKDFLYLITRISTNHHRYPDLSSKIERILLRFKTEMLKNFSNLELFNVFEKDKRLLLFLFNQKILFPDHSLFNIISDFKHKQMNYTTYFYPEFKNFIDNPTISQPIASFEKTRQNFDKENYISKLIKNDSIDEFVIYVNKNNISLNSTIKESIFETNPLLINKSTSFIQYSAFYGSLQIFNYLRLSGVELNSSLWIYAIHGKNPVLLHILEDNHVEFDLEMKIKCLKESIKCHHNDFSEYIQNQYFDNEIETNEYLIDKIKHHNYLSLPNDIFEMSQFFFYFCKYDYYQFVDYLLNNKKIDVNLVHNKKVDDKKDGYIETIDDNYNYINFTNQYEEKNTPLCAAIKKGNKEIVQLLLKQNDIEINKQFSSESNILQNGSPSYSQLNEYKTPFFIAVENEHLEIVQLLLKLKDININEESINYKHSKELGGTLCGKKAPLHIAIEKQNIQILNCLLDNNNIDINIIQKMDLDMLFLYEKSPLHIAIDTNNEEIVQILLSNKINQSTLYRVYQYQIVCDAPSYYDDLEIKSSLQLAVQNKNIKIIEMLLKNEKNINMLNTEKIQFQDNITQKAALHIAVENQCLDIVKLLLSSKDIDVNLQAYYNEYKYIDGEIYVIIQNKTPLLIAIENNDMQMIELLLKQNGIDIDIKLDWVSSSEAKENRKKRTALDLAIENKNEEIICLLNKK